jgi:hypothetical protein
MLNRSYLLISLLSVSSLYGSNYSLSVSADTTRFDYSETSIGGVLLDTEKADFNKVDGFSARFESDYRGLYAGVSYAKGNTDYVGSILHSGNPYGSYLSSSSNTTADYSIGYKATAAINQDVSIPLYIGLGYRQWLRQGGYDETYEWGYSEAGIGLHWRPSPQLSLGADAFYRQAFNAQMHETLNGYTFNLNNVYGYKITVPIEYKLSQNMSTYIAYSYDYWNIGASNVVGGYYEPDSQTKNDILSFGLKFLF